MVVYHGGYTEIDKPHIINGKYPKDFGHGFYCTYIKEQAIRWAKRYETPVLNAYQYDTEGLAQKTLKLLQFDEMTEEWLDFVVRCRSGKTHDYDVVSGAMANDQIFNYIADFVSGILTREQFWILAKFKRPTNQMCFCTTRALEFLAFTGSEVL